MKKLEILAPVGGPEQLTAAVRAGADAVYLGTTGFNARRNAKNFSAEDLPSVVSFCHARGVRVHVTVNTLIFDDEYDALLREADAIAAAGVDAVIVQDLAVAELFRTRYPSIRRHASTQMAVHNLDGARQAEALGFDRVVLARELSRAEIRKISENVSIETEMFVHGAHCMSLSGACYLSSLIGGRSGNRGTCAQPCRTDFRVGQKSYALSLKDMSYVNYIPELAGLGVVSLKIEGRMKRPEYVAAAVTACRQSRAHQPYDLETLEKVFSRSGFTSGYLDGKRTGDMFGVRTQSDIEASSAVIGELAALYRAEYPGIAADMALTATENETVLTVSDGENKITVKGDAPQAALSRPLDADGARRFLSRTGGTPFYLDKLEFHGADGLFVPASQLNAMRAQALNALLEARGRIAPHVPAAPAPAMPKPHEAKEPALWGKFETLAQARSAGQLDRIILPAAEIAAHPECVETYGDKLVCAFEPVLFPQFEDRFDALAETVRALGVHAAWTENIYGVSLAKRLGMTLCGGCALNITNSRALESYAAMGFAAVTVSFEASAARIAALGGDLPRGAVQYGYLPAMRTRACPVMTGEGCGKCAGRAELTDRKGVRFPFVCAGKAYGTLYNSVPLYAFDRRVANVDFRLAVFTIETPQEVREIMTRIRDAAPLEKPMTRGLYFREVL